MHQDPSDIASEFEDATTQHGDHKCPSTLPDPDRRLNEEDDEEEGGVEGVTAHVWDIFEGGIVFGTCFEGAETWIIPQGEVEGCGMAGEGQVLVVGHGDVLWASGTNLSCDEASFSTIYRVVRRV